MRRASILIAGVFSATAFGLALSASAQQACKSEPRIVELAPGRHAGAWPLGFTPLLLQPKEVVLIFDDGPNPDLDLWRILETLKENCLKRRLFPHRPPTRRAIRTS